MKSKLFLTSLTAIAFAMPALADNPTTSGTFPTGENGYMQENYIYTNAATSTNMDGVYEGTVNATAYYDDILYQIAAGQYLAHATTTGTECPAGSFCGGLTNALYDENNDQGITACSTLDNGAFPNSAAGSSLNTECYRACTVANANIAHAATVTGNDYYGAGVDTCEPTACENGWHVKPGAPDLTTIIGVTEAATGYTSNDYTSRDYGTDGMSNTIISNDPMAFAVDYGNSKGVIKGHGRCSKTGVTTPWYNTQGYQFASDHFVNNLTDETDPATGGHYCYCQLDSYTPVNGSAQSLSAPWVFNYAYRDVGSCADSCAFSCADYLQNDVAHTLAFRAAVFGSIQSSPAMCEGNEITINWGDVDPNYEGDNNEGTAIYGEDIRTPVKAATKPGQTFKGWKFVKPQN